jgi:hypothetical protein
MANPLIPSKPVPVKTQKTNHSAGILDDYAIRKNISTKEGTIEKVPINDSDIANKLYVDSQISGENHWDAGGSVGNETLYPHILGSKVGIGTTSPSAKLDVSGVIKVDTGAFALGSVSGVDRLQHTTDAFRFYTSGDEHIMTIQDTGNVGIGTTSPNESLTVEAGKISLKETTTPTATAGYGKIYTKSDNKLYFQDGDGTEHNTTYTAGDGLTLTGNEFDCTITQYTDALAVSAVATADDYLKNDASDTTTGTLTAAGFLVTGDSSSADTAYVPMVLYNTDATPPTASGFPVGTLYIQYTA